VRLLNSIGASRKLRSPPPLPSSSSPLPPSQSPPAALSTLSLPPFRLAFNPPSQLDATSSPGESNPFTESTNSLLVPDPLSLFSARLLLLLPSFFPFEFTVFLPSFSLSLSLSLSLCLCLSSSSLSRFALMSSSAPLARISPEGKIRYRGV